MAAGSDRRRRRRRGMAGQSSNRIGGGLSARLLILTVVFVMASVVLVFVPSVTRERLTYLEDRIDAAHLAIFALEATPDNMVSKNLADMLLAHVGAHGIGGHMADRTLMLAQNMPPSVAATYDLRTESMPRMMGDTIATLVHSGNRAVRVLGVSPKDRSVTVEIVLDEAPLRRQLWEFGGRVLAVSFIISLITAALVYLTLRWLLVAPLRRMTASMMAFRDNPEDESRIIRLSPRSDEVGLAERELAAMQETVRQSLRQKERLAALGTAVSKINHDLRGILSTARLTSDSLAGSDSPEVKRVVPALLAAIDRAVALCTGTLNYTRDSAPPLCPGRAGRRARWRDRPAERQRLQRRQRGSREPHGPCRPRSALPRAGKSGAQRFRERRPDLHHHSHAERRRPAHRRQRRRARPAAQSAAASVHAVRGLRSTGWHRARTRHRARSDAGAWRRNHARTERCRRHHLRAHAASRDRRLIERQQLGFQVRAFRQEGMHRMVRRRAGALQNASAAAGVDDAAPDGLGELGHADVVRTRRDEEQAARRNDGGGETRQFAITAKAGAEILLRFDERRRIGDDDVETLASRRQVLELGKRLGAPEAAACLDAVCRRRPAGERERPFRPIDRDDLAGASAGRCHRKAAREAIGVEQAAILGQSGDRAPVLALVV